MINLKTQARHVAEQCEIPSKSKHSKRNSSVAAVAAMAAVASGEVLLMFLRGDRPLPLCTQCNVLAYDVKVALCVPLRNSAWEDP